MPINQKAANVKPVNTHEIKIEIPHGSKTFDAKIIMSQEQMMTLFNKSAPFVGFKNVEGQFCIIRKQDIVSILPK